MSTRRPIGGGAVIVSVAVLVVVPNPDDERKLIVAVYVPGGMLAAEDDGENDTVAGVTPDERVADNHAGRPDIVYPTGLRVDDRL